jgi:deoxyribonuclease-4
LSVAGGTWKAVERAVDLGCTALQIFTQAPARWAGREIAGKEAERFRRSMTEAGLAGVTFSHAPYLINLASPDDGLRRRSLETLADQLAKARMLGLVGVVLHPGSHQGSGSEEGVGRVAEAIAEALRREPGAPKLLIEVTAGQGTSLGCSFSEIAAILDRLDAERVGTCWDTAHLWAAGYDIATSEGWEETWKEFRELTGRSAPDLLHLNDARVDLGSRVDRHERIGQGRLGVETFARVVTDPRLARIPMVLETPKGPDEVTWDREALELLRSLFEPGAAEMR